MGRRRKLQPLSVHVPLKDSASQIRKEKTLESEFNEELAYWEKDPQEEEVQHAGLDYEETIQRYDAMVRREWVPFLQACLVYGSNCVAALTQLLLLPVFDPLAHFRVADQYLPNPLGVGVL
eukprot:3947566-Amphidinium_carterae.1